MENKENFAQKCNLFIAALFPISILSCDQYRLDFKVNGFAWANHLATCNTHWVQLYNALAISATDFNRNAVPVILRILARQLLSLMMAHNGSMALMRVSITARPSLFWQLLIKFEMWDTRSTFGKLWVIFVRDFAIAVAIDIMRWDFSQSFRSALGMNCRFRRLRGSATGADTNFQCRTLTYRRWLGEHIILVDIIKVT